MKRLLSKLIRFQELPRVHACYKPVADAVNLTGSGWVFKRLPARNYYIFGKKVSSAILLAPLHVLEHLQLAWEIILEDDQNRLFFVREYLSIPLAIVSPFWMYSSNRIFWQNNHTVQAAFMNSIHRIGLYFLRIVGAKFVSHDTDIFCKLGMLKFDQNLLIIPFPTEFRGSLPARRWPPVGYMRVGIVGSLRPEQRSESALELIRNYRAQSKISYDIVIGSNDRDRLEQFNADDVSLSFFRGEEDYWRCLESIDIVVVNYDPARYFWRTSGIVADAVSSGSVVVAPNFPVISRQLEVPNKVGFCFFDPSSFGDALSKAFLLAKNDDPRIRSERYCAGRSVPEISCCLAKMRQNLRLTAGVVV